MKWPPPIQSILLIYEDLVQGNYEIEEICEIFEGIVTLVELPMVSWDSIDGGEILGICLIRKQGSYWLKDDVMMLIDYSCLHLDSRDFLTEVWFGVLFAYLYAYIQNGDPFSLWNIFRYRRSWFCGHTYWNHGNWGDLRDYFGMGVFSLLIWVRFVYGNGIIWGIVFRLIFVTSFDYLVSEKIARHLRETRLGNSQSWTLEIALLSGLGRSPSINKRLIGALLFHHCNKLSQLFVFNSCGFIVVVRSNMSQGQ